MKQAKGLALVLVFLASLLLGAVPGKAAVEWDEESLGELFNMEEQLDALGKGELMDQVPEGARELMEETDTFELSVSSLLQLSPRQFFATIWRLFLAEVKRPFATLSVIVGVLLLSTLLGGLRTAAWESNMSRVFDTVSVLCILGSVAAPILSCIRSVTATIVEASQFMLSFIPMFSGALVAAGQPVTGATYNMFLLTACQVVSQIVSQMLIPLMGIYLALCITGALVPEIDISSTTATMKTVVGWALGFLLTAFVGLLSLQTMVGHGADSVATKTTKFVIGSVVPVVGSALSEAYLAAQSCLRLVKTTVGAYGMVAALFTFLPILIKTFAWYAMTNAATMASDLLGVKRASGIFKACSSVLGILLAVIICYALLIIVSTAVVMVTGLGTA